MEYLFSFLFAGTICLIGQIIFDNTKLTPGHIVSMFVVLGAILSFFGLYEYLLKYAPGGAAILIMNYGNLLYQAGYEGLKGGTLLDAMMNIAKGGSATLVIAVTMGFLCSILKKNG